MAELHLLGPVQLWVAGRVVDLGPAKQRTVLAALLVETDWPMPTDTLVDRVWGDEPPASARSALYSYVARLRLVLRGAVAAGDPHPTVDFGPGGYRVDLAGHRVDLHRFRELVAQARDDAPGRAGASGDGAPGRAGDDDRRVALLDEAVGLWHGPALADLPGDWAARTRQLLAHQLLDATLLWAQAQLRLGRANRVTGPLRELIGEHPLVEPLAATLMEALRRAGRSAEALDCYAAVRRRLVDALGVEPGPELRRLHREILRHDGDGPPGPGRGRTAGDGGGGGSDREVEAASPLPVPAQLPLDVHGFTGRQAELGRLDGLLAVAQAEATAVVVCVLSGGAGVGKTALAVHWAHRVVDRFPDGQLFVNLRGFDPAGEPTTPAVAVRVLLDALGVVPQQVPVSEEAQVGLYRSLLAGKRILVVLDNAAAADQVRPLLPGAPGCLALVTSRDQLSGLGASEAALTIEVGVLSAADAGDLLAARVGPARVAAEPAAAGEIAQRCAGLPLALAVVAARAAAQPHATLAGLAAELTEDRLDAFADSDPATDLRHVFSWSYRTLSGEAARLFRLFGLHPGPYIDAPAAASLAGVSMSRVRRQLTELTRAHLITEPRPGRFTFHDLLRAYATELAEAHDPAPRRRTALHRMLDHYVHGAHAAARMISPHRESVDLAPRRPGVVAPEHFDDLAQAMAWLTERRAVLLASLRLAARVRFPAHTSRLAWAIAPSLDRSGHWRELAEVHELAVIASDHLGDRAGQAYAHRIVGRAWTRLGEPDAARTHYEHALRVAADIGDDLGRAHTHLSLAWLHEQGRQYREAVAHADQARALYAAAGHVAGLASALNQVGWYHAQLGEFDDAVLDCERALVLQVEAGNRYGQASAWDSLGFANHHLGRCQQAARCYEQALRLHRDNGDRYREATTLVRFGDCRHAAGDADAARQEWGTALRILEDIKHPDADDVRVTLQGCAILRS